MCPRPFGSTVRATSPASSAARSPGWSRGPAPRASRPLLGGIEFARAELPWLFTPAVAKAERLRPCSCWWWAPPRRGTARHLASVRCRCSRLRTGASRRRTTRFGAIVGVVRPCADSGIQRCRARAESSTARPLCPLAPRLPAAPRHRAPRISRASCPRRRRREVGLGDPLDEADEAALPGVDGRCRCGKAAGLPLGEVRDRPAGTFETLVRLLQPRPLGPGVGRSLLRWTSANAGSGRAGARAGGEGAVIGMQAALRAPRRRRAAAVPQTTRRHSSARSRACSRLLPDDTITRRVPTASAIGGTRRYRRSRRGRCGCAN